MLTQADIIAHLQNFTDPYLQQDLVNAKAIQSIAIDDDNNVVITVKLGYPARGYQTQLTADLTASLQPLHTIKSVKFHINWEITPHTVQPGLKTLPGVKNIIAISSGKGGVGKS